MSARKVFGRRKATIEDVPVYFEMRTDGVHIHRKRCRTKYHLSWDKLWTQATGQYEFAFQQHPVARKRPGQAKGKKLSRRYHDELSGKARVSKVRPRPKVAKKKLLAQAVAPVLGPDQRPPAEATPV